MQSTFLCNTDPNHEMSQVMDESHMVMTNCGCDSTGDAQGDVQFENPLAGMPIPAMLSDDQHGILCEEDDQHGWMIARSNQVSTMSKSLQSFLL